MGVLKFRLPSNDLEARSAGFRKAYIAGLDRTPGRIGLDIRNGLMTCSRDNSESGRLFVPWPIAGYGTPVVGTATLPERPTPYVLSLELARGKLNDVRNQMADWTQMGLRTTPELGEVLASAHRAFVRAAMRTDDPAACLEASQESLEASSNAGDILTDSYMAQVLHNRTASTGKLTTQFGCVLNGDPEKTPGSAQWPSAMNAAQISVSWRRPRSLGGEVPLGTDRRPVGLVPPPPPERRGRAADRVPQRRASRLDLALGRRPRRRRRLRHRPGPPGRRAVSRQGPVLAGGASPRRPRNPRARRGGPEFGSPRGPSRSPDRPIPTPNSASESTGRGRDG